MRTGTDSEKIRVLLTGFGPFPRVAHNASSRLVDHLARLAPERWPDAHVHAATLPTEWTRGLADLEAHWSTHAPHVALHFGVSERATGLVIERTAYNACGIESDACGACADADVLLVGGPPHVIARHDLDALAARLNQAAIPSCISADPGRYLCNAVYFHSLQHVTSARHPAHALFVHIPAGLSIDANGCTAPDCPLDWQMTCDGAALVLDHMLAFARQQLRPNPRMAKR